MNNSDPIWIGVPMPEDYTCSCGLYVHKSKRNPLEIHIKDCPYINKEKEMPGFEELKPRDLGKYEDAVVKEQPKEPEFQLTVGDMILCTNLLEENANKHPLYAEDRKNLAKKFRKEVERRQSRNFLGQSAVPVAPIPKKLALEKRAFELFMDQFDKKKFGSQRLGQAFYDHFKLGKLNDQTQLCNIYAKDGEHATRLIKTIFDFY